MQLGYHGGKCCGIKTIFSMGYDPAEIISKIDAVTYDRGLHNKDASGSTVSSKDTMFNEAAPKESYEERLDRFLDFLKRKRPSGLVEIALMQNCTWPEKKYYSQHLWFPILEARGFKVTSRFKNSNSNNMVTVYHLVMLNGEIQTGLTDQGFDTTTVTSPDDDEEFCCSDSCGSPGCCCSCGR